MSVASTSSHPSSTKAGHGLAAHLAGGLPHLAAALGFLLLSVLIFRGGLASFFLADDFSLLLAQRQAGPFSQFTHRPSAFFRPLSALSFYLDQVIWDLNPVGFHLTNVLLNGLNAFLLMQICRVLLGRAGMAPRRAWAGGLGAGLLFVIHPVHSEAVNWLAARMDVLASALGLLALWLYLRYQERRKGRLLLFVLLAFVLSLLSKEALLTFPLVVLFFELLEIWRSRGEELAAHRLPNAGVLARWPWVRRLLPVLAFFLVIPVYVLVRRLALGTLVGGYGSAVHLSLDLRLWLRHLATDVARLFLPILPLQPQVAGSTAFYLPVVGLAGAGLAWLCWQAWDQRSRASSHISPVLLCLALAIPAALLPSLTLSVSLTDVGGERFLYWPSVFAVLLLAGGLTAWLPQARRFWPVILLVGLIYGFGLWRSNQTWQMAAKISRSIVQSVVELPPAEHNLIVNLPDNIHGAIILRNGLGAAAQLYGDNRQGQLDVLGYAVLAERDPAITVRKDQAIFSVWTNVCDSIIIPRPVGERYQVAGLPGCGFQFQLPGAAPGESPGEAAPSRILIYTKNQLMEFVP